MYICVDASLYVCVSAVTMWWEKKYKGKVTWGSSTRLRRNCRKCFKNGRMTDFLSFQIWQIKQGQFERKAKTLESNSKLDLGPVLHLVAVW